MFLRTLAVLCVLSAAFTTKADALEAAVSVTWGAAQRITGVNDVSTAGTLLYAYNLGDANVSPAIINGVQFKPWATSNDGQPQESNIGSAILNVPTTGSGYLVSYNTLGTSTGAFAGLTAAYQKMASSGTSATSSTPLTLHLKNLIAGDEYQIQWWLNNSSLQTGTPTQTTASAVGTVTLTAGSSTGALGQYVIGVFTATGDSTTISFNGGGTSFMPMINGFQLRDLSIVPEPSTYVFATIATCTLGFLAYRRKDHPAQV